MKGSSDVVEIGDGEVALAIDHPGTVHETNEGPTKWQVSSIQQIPSPTRLGAAVDRHDHRQYRQNTTFVVTSWGVALAMSMVELRDMTHQRVDLPSTTPSSLATEYAAFDGFGLDGVNAGSL